MDELDELFKDDEDADAELVAKDANLKHLREYESFVSYVLTRLRKQETVKTFSRKKPSTESNSHNMEAATDKIKEDLLDINLQRMSKLLATSKSPGKQTQQDKSIHNSNTSTPTRRTSEYPRSQS
jgi:hypothetical protein